MYQGSNSSRHNWAGKVNALAVFASAMLHFMLIIILTGWAASGSKERGEGGQASGTETNQSNAQPIEIVMRRAELTHEILTNKQLEPQPSLLKARAESEYGEFATDEYAANDRAEKDPEQQSMESAALGSARSRDGVYGDGTELLSLIARCLPNDVRPSFPLTKLILQFDEAGALRAAPRLESILPILSADSTQTADKVVQAVLQCGPYPSTSYRGETVALTADFSAVASRSQ